MIIISILSFFLDGIFSILCEKNSLLLALFSLCSLIVIYPFINDKYKLLFFSLGLGFSYDIIYTQTPLLYTILFVLLGLFIMLYFRFIPHNIITSIFCTVLVIFLYRLLSYTCVVFINEYNFDFNEVLKSFYSSLISNLIYVVLIGSILKIYYKKKGKKKSYNYQI